MKMIKTIYHYGTLLTLKKSKTKQKALKVNPGFIANTISHLLGLDQTSNFSWDEPNLVSQVREKFDVSS